MTPAQLEVARAMCRRIVDGLQAGRGAVLRPCQVVETREFFEVLRNGFLVPTAWDPALARTLTPRQRRRYLRLYEEAEVTRRVALAMFEDLIAALGAVEDAGA